MSEVVIEIGAPEIVISFDGCIPFDAEAWAEALPEYNSNEDAVTALGADKIYCAGSEHQVAGRGTLMRTFEE